jgi:hypothetical protein
MRTNHDEERAQHEGRRRDEDGAGHDEDLAWTAEDGPTGHDEDVEVATGPGSPGGRRRSRLLGMPVQVRDAGMATAEYAIVTVAAAGFAGLLIAILRSDEVRGLLLGIVRGALAV